MSVEPTETITIHPKYLSDFSKALASEIQILLREVLVLGDERRALQYEVEKYKAAKAKLVAENKPKAEDVKAEPAWRVVELSPEKRKLFEKLKPKPEGTPEVVQATADANDSKRATGNGVIVPSTSKAASKPDFPSWIPWKPLRQKGTPPKSLPAPESTPPPQGSTPQAPPPPPESPPPALPAPKPVRAPTRSDSWATWRPDPKFAPTPPLESPPKSPPKLPTGLFGTQSPRDNSYTLIPQQPSANEPNTRPAHVKFSTPPRVSSPGLFGGRTTPTMVDVPGGLTVLIPPPHDLDVPAPVRDPADSDPSDARKEGTQDSPSLPPPASLPSPASPPPPPPLSAPGPIETAPSWASWQPNPDFAPTPPPGDLEPVLELHEPTASQSGRSNDEDGEEAKPSDGTPAVAELRASEPTPQPFDLPQESALGLSGLGDSTDAQEN